MLYCRIFALRAHLRNSPPSLLIIGNNSLKQLAFGARANSPAPIGRSSNYHNPECSRCVRRIMLFLKVVMVVSKSQYGWVKNADAPSLCALLRCSRRLRPELSEPTDCAMRTRELLVPVKLRISFPHRPVQRLVAGSTFMQITAFACHYDNTSVRKLALPVYGICQNTYIFSQTSMCGLNEGVTYMRVPSCSKPLDHAAYKSRHVSLYFTRS